jgi:hypothetical protein
LNPRVRAALGKVKRRLKPTPPPPRKAAAPAKRPARPVHSRHQALPGDRLLEQPAFVLSSIRSGSTLLRVMLNTHSAIHAPHELHLGGIGVTLQGRYTEAAMDEIGLDTVQLQYLLWDRLLHRELVRHGKSVLVNKTPSDAFRWRRILECWPDARFIFLLRHPAAITDSWWRAHPERQRDKVAEDVLRYMVAVEDARTKHGGLTVRYEDITTSPEQEMKRICDYLGVKWQPSMVEYGQGRHGDFQAGLGDWSERIRSGKVQPVEKLPTREETPASLIDISTKWGYLTAEA